MTINTITLGTQQTKTIRQRMTFQISNNQNEFIDFLKKELPDKKINKQFIVNFYQILVENAPLFPNIDKKKRRHKNFLAFQEHYFNTLNYIN